MRTTITLPDALAAAAKRLTGKSRLSEAVTSLIEQESLRAKQMAALEMLRKGPLPHDMKKIKAARKAGSWSASTRAS